jgi:pimeloyl-ACP methyl ester carboxylesterase
LFRISHGKNQEQKNGNPPILIQHGIFDSADFVVAHGPESSPAFYLANQGYDVWVANSRGNKYSRQHTTLNPDKDKKFWDYSFFDMINDYKANIQFVLQKTGTKKIPVIGHSQGTSSMLAGLSTDMDWFKQRVTLFVSLGTVARLDHMTSPLLRFLCYSPLALNVIKKLGIVEMFPSDFLTKASFIALCGTVPEICQYGAKIVADADPKVDDKEWARIYFGHFPSGSSTKCLEHYSQIYNSKKFQMFDYGKEENQKRYGSDIPPSIPLSNIDLPIAKFTGNTDCLGDLDDNKWLSGQLGSNLVFDKVYDFGHLTFFIGKDMGYLNDMMNVLNNYRAEMEPTIKLTPEAPKELLKTSK